MQISRFKTILHMLFLNNGYWKLLALVIAVLIYFTIRADISHMRVVSVPVEVTNESDAADAAVWSVEPRSVKVSIRGSYADTSGLTGVGLKCIVRARQKSSGVMDTVRMNIKSKHIQGTGDARVVKIDPDYVDVKFDVPDSLTLAVDPPNVEGTARGTVKLSYDVTNAVVTGSRRLLGSLDLENARIQCEPIDVSGRLESFTTNVRLVPPGGAVNVAVDPAEMIVNVFIISERSSRKIEGIPIVVVQPASSANQWVTEPEFVDIEVAGRAEILKSVKYGDIMASVDGNVPLVPGLTNEVPVITHLRQGLAVDSAKAVPEKVKLIPVVVKKNPQSGVSSPADLQ